MICDFFALICIKARGKLNTLVRIAPFIGLSKIRMLMNVFLILKLVFMFPDLDRGYKKQKDSLETPAVLIEISHLC